MTMWQKEMVNSIGLCTRFYVKRHIQKKMAITININQTKQTKVRNIVVRINTVQQ